MHPNQHQQGQIQGGGGSLPIRNNNANNYPQNTVAYSDSLVDHYNKNSNFYQQKGGLADDVDDSSIYNTSNNIDPSSSVLQKKKFGGKVKGQKNKINSHPMINNSQMNEDSSNDYRILGCSKPCMIDDSSSNRFSTKIQLQCLSTGKCFTKLAKFGKINRRNRIEALFYESIFNCIDSIYLEFNNKLQKCNTM